MTYPFAPTAVPQQLAQLGFIVIQVGNRGGSPQRSKAYQSFGYFNLRDYGLADKKAGIEQLAARHTWIDIDRVGIYGHSGGGFMTAAAMLLPPYNEFFKVGVSESGNHDNNIYNQNWSEQYHGLKVVAEGDATGSVAGAIVRTAHRRDDGMATRGAARQLTMAIAPTLDVPDSRADDRRARAEPQGQPAARDGRHGQQRPPGEHDSPGERADQGEQAVRLHDAAGQAARRTAT